jgi:hypothetical protein
MTKIPESANALRKLIMAIPELVSVVGDNVFCLGAYREYPERVVILGLRGGSKAETLEGDDGLYFPDIQVDCHAEEYDTAETMATKIYNAIMSLPIPTIVDVGEDRYSICDVNATMPNADDEPLLTETNFRFSVTVTLGIEFAEAE